jgi:hypothetical protein
MFDSQRTVLERAAATAQTALAELQAAEMTELYAPPELERRRQAVLATFEQAASSALTEVQTEAQRAEDQLTRLEIDDPMRRLPSEQLAEAGNRRWLIEEDAGLPYRDVLPRVRAALVENKAVDLALWARYLGRRLEAEQSAQMRPNSEGLASGSTVQQDPDLGAVWDAYRTLTERVSDPKLPERRSQAEATLNEAKAFEYQVVNELRMGLNGGRERALAHARAVVNQAF